MIKVATREWREVESEVHRPGEWLAWPLGFFFLLAGTAGFVGIVPPAGMPSWVPKLFTAGFVLLGESALAAAIWRLPRVYVRHAAASVLPNISCEPVLQVGSEVSAYVAYELVRDADGWQFRPRDRVHRAALRCLLGFAVTFMAIFTGIMSWIAHEELRVGGWAVSTTCGGAVSAVCFGTVVLFVYMRIGAAYGRLCRLSIPAGSDEIELDSAEEPDPGRMDLAAGLKWAFQPKAARHHLTIRREQLIAVQLCPWRFALGFGSNGTDFTWAAQGLLVVSVASEPNYHRLPILLTSDCVGAARLMQALAGVLEVPYLFGGDAEGWKAESLRAKTRPPLHMGAM